MQASWGLHFLFPETATPSGVFAFLVEGKE
jgi:hypothetical protein